MASTASAAASTLPSRDPATGAVLGRVRVCAPEEVAAAVAQARGAQALWWQLRLRDRARYLRRAAQAVIDEADELARVIGAEQGRPRAEVELMELLPAIETLQWLADHGPGVLSGERARIPWTMHPFTRGGWSYEPLGVVAVLGPAPEPFATPLGDAAVALMAGNGVVLKPSPLAPLAGERIARVFARAGLPEGLLQVVQGPAATGAALVEADVDQVRFTGSAATGRAVGEVCARRVKRSVLELGGRDVALVCADADPRRAGDGVGWAAWANAGQAGGSVKEVFVLEEVHDAFLETVLALAGRLVVGDPRDAATDIGPLVEATRADRVLELVAEAEAAGAVRHKGGRVAVGTLKGAWVAPIVLTGVPSGTRVLAEEVPGPVLVVHAVASEEEAITRANAAAAGLGASVWTADRLKGRRIARELRVGMVWLNDHRVSRGAPQLPWGGVGGSGIGRARGAVALRTAAEAKVITWDPPHGRPARWFPYDQSLTRAARAIGELRSIRDADRERALRSGVPSLARVARRGLGSLRR